MFDKLFEPMKIGKVIIKNRLVVPPMHSGSATKGHRFSEQSLNYYTARAKGGFGLIITEFLCVSREGLADETQVGIYNDSFIPNLTELAKRIHDNGAACFAQIHHAGIQSDFATTNQIPVGASSIPAENRLQPVHELTSEEVWGLVAKFGDAALRAKKARFDGVEIHGAHGYLVAQFLSKSTNKRTDEFGGTNSTRAKFACEIIKDVKKKCGEDYPVIVRISGVEDIKYGNTIIDSAAQAIVLEQAGADAIHVSVGTAVSETIILPNYVQPGFNIINAAEIKENVNIPVICVGRINDPAVAVSTIASGAADFVAIGRQSICDSEFPNKVKENRLDEIFYCSACMQRCADGSRCDEDDIGVSCMINPFSGKEGFWEIKKSEKAKTIVIIGAGPAGLQAAWLLAKRGNNVTLLEKEKSAGGQLKLASIPPMKHDFARSIYTYVFLCNKYGVKIQYGIEVNEKVLKSYDADTIILATGSSPYVPLIRGIDGKNVYMANDILKGVAIIGNKNVLVIGAGPVGCETADFLSLYNNDITIVDILKEMAPSLGYTRRKYLLSRLKDSNIKFYPETKVLELTPDGIKYKCNRQIGKLSGFDSVVLAIGSISHNPLLEVSKKICEEVYSIGDAKQVSDAVTAVYGATKVAMLI